MIEYEIEILIRKKNKNKKPVEYGLRQKLTQTDIKLIKKNNLYDCIHFVIENIWKSLLMNFLRNGI